MSGISHWTDACYLHPLPPACPLHPAQPHPHPGFPARASLTFFQTTPATAAATITPITRSAIICLTFFLKDFPDFTGIRKPSVSSAVVPMILHFGVLVNDFEIHYHSKHLDADKVSFKKFLTSFHICDMINSQFLRMILLSADCLEFLPLTQERNLERFMSQDFQRIWSPRRKCL